MDPVCKRCKLDVMRCACEVTLCGKSRCMFPVMACSREGLPLCRTHARLDLHSIDLPQRPTWGDLRRAVARAGDAG